MGGWEEVGKDNSKKKIQRYPKNRKRSREMVFLSDTRNSRSAFIFCAYFCAAGVTDH